MHLNLTLVVVKFFDFILFIALGQNGEAVGFLVIYGDAGHYLKDGVEWQSQEKLNLKLIVRDTKTNRYKLRNSKNDDGEPVMRRHKRVGAHKELGWQRHEYKLFTEETAHRQNVDGTKTTVTRRTLNPWPILVHYFRPSVPVSVLRAHASSTSTTSTTISSLTSKTKSTESAMDRRMNQIPGFPSDNDDESSEYNRVTKKQKTGANDSRDSQLINESDSENGSISSAGLTRAFRTLQTPLFKGELAPIVNVKPAPSIQKTGLDGVSTSWLSAKLQQNLAASRSTGVASTADPSSSLTAFSTEKETSIHTYSAMQTDESHPDAGEESHEHSTELLSSPKIELALWAETSAENMNLTSGDEPCIYVTHYAPEASFCEEECAVLVVLSPETLPGLALTCFVDGIQCNTEVVAPQVLRVLVPAHASGVVPMWLVGKDANGEVSAHSDSLPFYYLPSARDGALSLAHAPSMDYFTSEVFFKFRHTTRELDVTGNNLTNLDFLKCDFSELRELVLDHNELSHWTNFPQLPKLTSLSVNHNQILQIDMFISQLQQAGLATRLKYLSTLGNAANPSLDRLEHRYYNFRIYIISKLPNLKMLDMKDVTEAERRHSRAISGEEELQKQHLEGTELQELNPRSASTGSTTSPDSQGQPEAHETAGLVEVQDYSFRTLSASPPTDSILSADPSFMYYADSYSGLNNSGNIPPGALL